MANPSLQNGYIKIANELVEKLAKVSISGSEMRILWVILRNTWGWKEGEKRKEWDKTSLSQFESATGMRRPNVAEALKSLVVKRLLLKCENGYSFNQNHDQWVVVKRLPPVVKSIRGSSQKHKEVVVKRLPSKERNKTTKENILSKFEEFWKNYPLKKGKAHAEKAWQKVDSELLPVILEAITNQKKEKQQLIQANQFCPEWKHPSTWLNARCWEDEVVNAKPQQMSVEEQNQRARENMKNFKSIMPD